MKRKKIWNSTPIVWIFLFLVTTNLKSQDDRKFHYGLNITPKVSKPYFENAELGEWNSAYGMSLGIDFYYDINSRIQLKTGLSYSFIQIKQNDYSLIFGCDLDPVNFEINTFNSWTEDEYQISYVGIPIESKFKLLGAEKNLYAKVGMEALYKIGSASHAFLRECQLPRRELEQNVINEPQDFVVKGRFGIGYEFKTNKKYKIYIEPQIEYSLNGIYKETGTVTSLINDARILDIGLMIGLRI